MASKKGYGPRTGNGSGFSAVSLEFPPVFHKIWDFLSQLSHRTLLWQRNKQRYIRKLRIFGLKDFWDISCWLGGAYTAAGAHSDHNKQPLLFRDKKVKWLDFGATSFGASATLVLHPGEAWLKPGYSPTIPWPRVRLTKVRRVGLTSDGLWAMPLHTGWVAVKAHRLQDFEKLKKRIPANVGVSAPAGCRPCGTLLMVAWADFGCLSPRGFILAA